MENKNILMEATSKTKFDTNLVQLTSIRLLDFQIYDQSSTPIDKKKIVGFSISVESQSGFNLNESMAQIELKLSFEAIDNDNKSLSVGGNVKAEFIYIINNLKDFIISEKEHQIDIELGGHLTGIAYSTLRGIVYAKTAGTIAENLILPIINPIDILQA